MIQRDGWKTYTIVLSNCDTTDVFAGQGLVSIVSFGDSEQAAAEHPVCERHIDFLATRARRHDW
jgi:hypothetical protein